jgi:preprotein translocase subunit SecY
MSLFREIFKNASLRRKLGFVAIIILIYRLGTHIPMAGVDLVKLEAMFLHEGGVLGFVNLFSGGALSRFSIFALGIIPYINASIIMQLLTVAWPQLKELQEEGEAGRQKVAQYTRYLSVGLAIVQAIVMTVSFRAVVAPDVSFAFFMIYASVSLVAGSVAVMWLGEMISEYGIGNGASILIFVGIVSQMPFYIKNTYVLIQGGTSILAVLAFVAMLVVMIVAIVFMQEAQRRIPVQYAKRVVGRLSAAHRQTYIPMRLIQGGVLPIIFASALLQFPFLIVNYLPFPAFKNAFMTIFSYTGVWYNLSFCLLILFFAYFYTAITFNPDELAENLKKYGGFVVGIRPGKPTAEFLDRVVSKLTLIGAIFLAAISILPVATANITNVTSFMGLGGTALLIIVGVAMDLVKQIETFLLSSKYEGFVGG